MSAARFGERKQQSQIDIKSEQKITRAASVQTDGKSGLAKMFHMEQMQQRRGKCSTWNNARNVKIYSTWNNEGSAGERKRNIFMQCKKKMQKD